MVIECNFTYGIYVSNTKKEIFAVVDTNLNTVTAFFGNRNEVYAIHNSYCNSILYLFKVQKCSNTFNAIARDSERCLCGCLCIF